MYLQRKPVSVEARNYVCLGLHRLTLSTATSCASPLLVFLLLYLSTRTNRTQGERPKRAAPPTRKLIENTQATAPNDPGDYSSIIRDADAIFAAVQAVSFSEPRTTAISSKAPVVDLDIAERGKITPRYGPKITTYRLLFAMAAGGDWEKTGKEACCNSSPRLKARYRPSLHT